MRQSKETLSIGDPAPLFVLPDEKNNKIFLAQQAGKPILLIFYANDNLPHCRQIAETFRDLNSEFEQLNVEIIGISSNPPSARKNFARNCQIPFALLSDINHVVSSQYGVCEAGAFKDNPKILSYSRRAFLLDINLRIVKIYSLVDLIYTTSEILADVKIKLPQPAPQHLTIQSPVLLIPNVLTPEYCRYLIHVWETEGNAESGQMRQQGEKTIGVIDYKFKIRRDHFVEKPELIK